MSMPKPKDNIDTIHRQARCSDGIVRRFYAPTSEMFDATYQLGYVVHNNMRVAGYIIQKPDMLIKHRFVCTLKPSPIPMSVVDGWTKEVNCCASRYCENCKRCVGGCKK